MMGGDVIHSIEYKGDGIVVRISGSGYLFSKLVGPYPRMGTKIPCKQSSRYHNEKPMDCKYTIV
jgi:hypothetical protein